MRVEGKFYSVPTKRLTLSISTCVKPSIYGNICWLLCLIADVINVADCQLVSWDNGAMGSSPWPELCVN